MKEYINMSDIDNYISGDSIDDGIHHSDTIKKLIELRRRYLKINEFFSKKSEIIENSDEISITVIVPVFNTSEYIEKCLDSILAQSFKDFEIICVDDQSTDDSWEKLVDYAKRDSRIKLVRHKKNLGLGGARNTALKMARGEYIASVDSDDYIAPNMLEVLYKTAKKENSCIVVCGFQRVKSDGTFLKPQRFKKKNLINKNNSIDIFSTCNPAFWNKLWRKDLFLGNNIFFPNYVFYQDLATTPRILTKAKKITFLEDNLYFYLIRQGSATYSHTPKHFADYFEVFSILRKFLLDNKLSDRYNEEFKVALKRACRFRAENIVNSSLDDETKKVYLSHTLAIQNYFLKTNFQMENSGVEKYLLAIDNPRHEVLSKKIPISIIIKTFCRPDLLERILDSIGSYQYKWGISFAEVLVGDDSTEDVKKINADVIKKVVGKFEDLKVKHLVFNYDVGLSFGRNKLVEASSEEIVLLCDDDFILDESCDFREALNVFADKKVDIMGGWLKNKYDLETGEYEYRAALGFFEREEYILRIRINEDKYKIPFFQECHFIMNFFMAKKNVLLKNPWDEELKIEEHHEFFYRAMLNGVRVSFCKLLFAKHTYEKPNNSSVYNQHRFSKERWRHYSFLALKKCGTNVRIIETKKFDRTVFWTVDRKRKISNEEIVKN